MLRRNFVCYHNNFFNMVYTSNYDLSNHGIVTFSHYPILTVNRTEKIKWMEMDKEFEIPVKYEIFNGEKKSYFLFRDVCGMEISKKSSDGTYKLYVEVNLVLLPICVYENKNRKIVNNKMRLLKKIFNN